MICECGKCGLEVKNGNRFISGHNSRLKNQGLGFPKKQFFCQCGCKQYVEDGKRGFISGHRAIGTRIKEVLNPSCICHCGCEGKTKNHNVRFIAGHSGKTVSKIIEKLSTSVLDGSYSPWGISGYYKGKQFRSSCELRYLREHENCDFLISAESSVYRISYIDSLGVERNYLPDFFDPRTKSIIEIKPFDWEEFQPESILKKAAAEKHCQEHGWSYSIIEIATIPKEQVFQLRDQNIITLDKKRESQYQQWKEKQLALLC